MPHWTFYKTTDDSNSLPEADQKKVRTTPDTVYDALSRWRRQIVGHQNRCRQLDLCFLGSVKTEIPPHCHVSLGERPPDNEYSRPISKSTCWVSTCLPLASDAVRSYIYSDGDIDMWGRGILRSRSCWNLYC